MKETQSTLADDLDARAMAAVDEAREMPPGEGRMEAMHKATALRNAVEIHAFLSSKRDTPAG